MNERTKLSSNATLISLHFRRPHLSRRPTGNLVLKVRPTDHCSAQFQNNRVVQSVLSIFNRTTADPDERTRRRMCSFFVLPSCTKFILTRVVMTIKFAEQCVQNSLFLLFCTGFLLSAHFCSVLSTVTAVLVLEYRQFSSMHAKPTKCPKVHILFH